MRGFFCLLAMLALWPFAASAATERVALVIGNANYEVGRLRNPTHDASDMSRALRELGFDVIEVVNQDRRGLFQAVQRFRDKLRPNGVALFFYSGHGVEMDGQNYLLPVDNGAIHSQADLRVEALPASYVLEQMESAQGRLNLVILDACRDNPLPASVRSLSKGLGPMTSASGTLIAYATRQGTVAADGSQRNSPFTTALLETLPRPGLTVRQIFDQVEERVPQLTDNRQQPWTTGARIPPLVLRSGASGAPTPAPAPAPETDRDTVYWTGSGCADGHLDGCRSYLQTFPQGFYAALAQGRLRPAPAQAAVQPPPAAASPQPADASHAGFIDQYNGFLLDTRTGLEWTQSDNGSNINWNDANRYCQGKGMRLPSIDELEGIYDRPGSGTTQCGSWTCKVSPLFRLTTPWPWSAMQKGSSEAWRLALSKGTRLSDHVLTPNGDRALCVRRRS